MVYLEKIPARDGSPKKGNEERWLKEGDYYFLRIQFPEESEISVYATLDGYYLEFSTPNEIIAKMCPDIKCVRNLIKNKEVLMIELEKSNTLEYYFIYDSKFPFDYFVGDLEVLPEEYFEYQKKLSRIGEEESRRHILPELSNITREYLDGKSKERKKK